MNDAEIFSSINQLSKYSSFQIKDFPKKISQKIYHVYMKNLRLSRGTFHMEMLIAATNYNTENPNDTLFIVPPIMEFFKNIFSEPLKMMQCYPAMFNQKIVNLISLIYCNPTEFAKIVFNFFKNDSSHLLLFAYTTFPSIFDMFIGEEFCEIALEFLLTILDLAKTMENEIIENLKKQKEGKLEKINWNQIVLTFFPSKICDAFISSFFCGAPGFYESLWTNLAQILFKYSKKPPFKILFDATLSALTDALPYLTKYHILAITKYSSILPQRCTKFFIEKLILQPFLKESASSTLFSSSNMNNAYIEFLKELQSPIRLAYAEQLLNSVIINKKFLLITPQMQPSNIWSHGLPLILNDNDIFTLYKLTQYSRSFSFNYTTNDIIFSEDYRPIIIDVYPNFLKYKKTNMGIMKALFGQRPPSFSFIQSSPVDDNKNNESKQQSNIRSSPTGQNTKSYQNQNSNSRQQVKNNQNSSNNQTTNNPQTKSNNQSTNQRNNENTNTDSNQNTNTNQNTNNNQITTPTPTKTTIISTNTENNKKSNPTQSSNKIQITNPSPPTPSTPQSPPKSSSKPPQLTSAFLTPNRSTKSVKFSTSQTASNLPQPPQVPPAAAPNSIVVTERFPDNFQSRWGHLKSYAFDRFGSDIASFFRSPQSRSVLRDSQFKRYAGYQVLNEFSSNFDSLETTILLYEHHSSLKSVGELISRHNITLYHHLTVGFFRERIHSYVDLYGTLKDFFMSEAPKSSKRLLLVQSPSSSSSNLIVESTSNSPVSSIYHRSSRPASSKRITFPGSVCFEISCVALDCTHFHASLKMEKAQKMFTNLLNSWMEKEWPEQSRVCHFNNKIKYVLDASTLLGQLGGVGLGKKLKIILTFQRKLQAILGSFYDKDWWIVFNYAIYAANSPLVFTVFLTLHHFIFTDNEVVAGWGKSVHTTWGLFSAGMWYIMKRNPAFCMYCSNIKECKELFVLDK